MSIEFNAGLQEFQSTYLYKVRHTLGIIIFLILLFQSTYLYKVRRTALFGTIERIGVSIHVPI